MGKIRFFKDNRNHVYAAYSKANAYVAMPFWADPAMQDEYEKSIVEIQREDIQDRPVTPVMLNPKDEAAIIEEFPIPF